MLTITITDKKIISFKKDESPKETYPLGMFRIVPFKDNDGKDGLVFGHLSKEAVHYSELIENTITLNGTVLTMANYEATALAANFFFSVGGSGVDVELIADLPATGEKGIIYLKPSDNPETGNIYEEYMWINGDWELVGSSNIELDAEYVSYGNTSHTDVDNVKEALDKLFDQVYYVPISISTFTASPTGGTYEQGYSIPSITFNWTLAGAAPTSQSINDVGAIANNLRTATKTTATTANITHTLTVNDGQTNATRNITAYTFTPRMWYATYATAAEIPTTSSQVRVGDGGPVSGVTQGWSNASSFTHYFDKSYFVLLLPTNRKILTASTPLESTLADQFVHTETITMTIPNGTQTFTKWVFYSAMPLDATVTITLGAN
jgi:hypothetical protein